jgi:flagellar protein FlbD
MIQLTRLNHKSLILNSDLIEHIETTPDTVLALTSGRTFVVRESAEEVVERIVKFRRELLEGTLKCPLRPPPGFGPGTPADHETSKDAR